jgi:hypothetical protein
MKIDDKGERLYKDMKALGEIKIWTWTMDKEDLDMDNGQRESNIKECEGIKDLDMDNGQRGSNIEECDWIKILEQKKHIGRGSKLMNLFDCI